MLNAAKRIALFAPPELESERLRLERVFAVECAAAALQVFERQWQRGRPRARALVRRSPAGGRPGEVLGRLGHRSG